MSDEQLRFEAMTLFSAGHETTANALVWTWWLLSQNPEAEARLHEELNRVLGGRAPTAADVGRLVYTRAVLAESVREWPAFGDTAGACLFLETGFMHQTLASAGLS